MLEVARDLQQRETFFFFSSGDVIMVVFEESYRLRWPSRSMGPLDPAEHSLVLCRGESAAEKPALRMLAFSVRSSGEKSSAPFSHTYGPGMDLNDGRVFADFVADLVMRRDILLKSDGMASRPFLLPG